MNHHLSEEEKRTARVLQTAEPLYVMLSDSTRLPFAECDDTTYDDEVLVFDSQKAAQNMADALTEEGFLVHFTALPVKQRLPFFSSLFSMGVNAICLNKGADGQGFLELTRFIARPEFPRFSAEIAEQLKKDKNVKFHVENPEFHLTAIHYIQKSRNRQAQRGNAYSEKEGWIGITAVIYRFAGICKVPACQYRNEAPEFYCIRERISKVSG